MSLSSSSTASTSHISIEETFLFLITNITMIIVGFIMWYYIWIKPYGIEIPNEQIHNERTISYFSSKNLSLILTHLCNKIYAFDKRYIIHSLGLENYIYLFFQRKIISLLITISICSLLFSTISYFLNDNNNNNSSSSSLLFILHFFINTNNTAQTNTYTSILQVTAIIIYTLLHFRLFAIIKREASLTYFNRFDVLSRNKNADWLSCRTLHISGLAPHERNTDSLTRKLNLFLEEHSCGKVIDINFIPNYKRMLALEKQKNQIVNIQRLIDRTKQMNWLRKLFFPKIYLNEHTMLNQLNILENNIQELLLHPVESSGHAFVCFDSLLSAFKVVSCYKENVWKKLAIKFTFMIESCRKRTRSNDKRSIIMYKSSHNEINNNNNSNKQSFTKFQEEEYTEHDYTSSSSPSSSSSYKVNILVDQMIEPFDIIWLNVGGERGIYVIRQVLCNILIIIILIFITFSTSYIGSQRVLEYFSAKTIKWIIFYIPYGHIIITYIPPLLLLSISIGINVLISYLCLYETHYTHGNYQLAMFSKTFIYMLFNLFIIPGFALSYELLSSLIASQITMQDLLSKIYLSNTYYFFMTMLIQTGTFSVVYYLLRINELLVNSCSPFITFYYRHFINIDNQHHRKESTCFYYGFFYAQMMVYYTITLVFSSTMPVVVLAGIYVFMLKHISDAISMLTVHGCEMDSNGKVINYIVNYGNVPLLIYHICMISLFAAKGQVVMCLCVICVFVLSVLVTWKNQSEFIFDIYALHEKLSAYDLISGTLSENEVNVWRNKYRHPCVIPIYTDDNNCSEHNGSSNQMNTSVNLI
jgi:hypothetical protein